MSVSVCLFSLDCRCLVGPCLRKRFRAFPFQGTRERAEDTRGVGGENKVIQTSSHQPSSGSCIMQSRIPGSIAAIDVAPALIHNHCHCPPVAGLRGPHY